MTAISPLGLTQKEAEEKLSQYGLNAIEETKRHPFFEFLSKFWGAIPWMLEIIFILQLSLGKRTEASITICLLIFNAGIGFIQESRARSALSLLKKKLQIKTRIFRDGIWTLIDAKEIVPGDLIRVRMGDFIPADIKLLEGTILIDRSALTGESLPVELTTNNNAFSGSIVIRGEATGLVIATGKRSFFGKTAALVGSEKSESHFAKIVLQVVEYLVLIDILLVSVILIYASITGMPLSEILPFSLILLIASVPIALPTTFTLMSALASLKLAEKGILVTDLTAIEESAGMEVICCDKTGTLTQNHLSLTEIEPLLPTTKSALIRFAAFTCNESSQDPIDMAILASSAKLGVLDVKNRLKFIPFDSMTKRSEALIKDDGRIIHIVKGAPLVIASLVNVNQKDVLINTAKELETKGYKVLSVAWGGENDQLALAGFLAFSDPIRKTSQRTIGDLKELGIAIKMVTGDASATAQRIAQEVGMESSCVCYKDAILSKNIEDCNIFAEMFPEDKYHLIQALQKEGYTVGMTGDGVNDAPALRQADMGVAIFTATDVAKAAASMILTKPGLGNLIEAIRTGRAVYRRMLTYTLNKVVKTIHIALFLSLGLLFENVFMTTPHLVMLLIFANDFVTMSLASDNVRISNKPCRFKIQFLSITSFVLAICWLGFSFGVFFIARDYFKLSLPSIQTLIFLMFVFSGLATVYLVRTGNYFWKMAPGKLLLISTCGDIIIVSILAHFGILMEPLSMDSILLLILSVFVFMAFLDQIKVFLLRRFSASKGF